MRIIDLEQGSQQWLSWRKSVITATDCSSIMGSNPWQSANMCWKRKLGIVEDVQQTDVMRRGIEMEPAARQQFIAETGKKMFPTVVESSEYRFLGASLDGLSGSEILEIKCGVKSHEMAKKGEIPEYYMHQMQHQLLVTKAQLCWYCSYDGQELITIKVVPDFDFQNEYLPRAKEFFRCLTEYDEPPLSEGDFLDKSHDIEYVKEAILYQSLSNKMEQVKAMLEQSRERLIKICDQSSCRGAGLRINKVAGRKTIAYKDIPQIKEMDLTPYQRISAPSWRITIDKKINDNLD